LYARLFIFVFGFFTVGETRQLLFHLFYALEGKIVLSHILQFLNVVLDVVHRHIKTTLKREKEVVEGLFNTYVD